MKTALFFIASIAASFSFDAMFGQIAAGILPPLAIAVLCYWYVRIDLKKRLLLALGSGILLDTIGFLPAGAYTLLLLLLAWACEVLLSFFSNTESRAVMMISLTVLLIGFRILVNPASFLVPFL